MEDTKVQPAGWAKENALTAPEDRDRENKWRPDQSAPPLTNEETAEAMKELHVTDFVKKFPEVSRAYADPALPYQRFGLISFVPAKGATPNESGVYGYAKLRGNFDTQMECDERTEHLIRNVDSVNSIFQCRTGWPFPCTVDSRYSANVSEIDIRKQMTESVSHNIKKARQNDEKEIQEIKAREEKLLEESRRAEAGEDPDPYETYITLRVKKAQLMWTYTQHKEKMEEVKNIIVNTRKDIQDMDAENPDFDGKYYEKYRKAREESGLETAASRDQDSNWMKFLAEDADIPEVDALYEEKYGDGSKAEA